MARMGVTKDQLDNSERVLLPVEEQKEVDGKQKMVRIRYPFQIVSSKEEVSKKQEGMLHITLSTEYNGRMVYIEDYFSYNQKALFRLAEIVKLLDLNAEALDTEDFLGKFVLATVTHVTITTTQTDEEGKPVTFEDNKIDRYLARIQPAENQEPATGDAPF